ncbi:hypothetical protein F2S88_15970 [Pseudomonas syringae pv. actinidiae]|nr:hypothetical protein [Pseudomonas syringae pv. actinidiae]
MPYAQLLAQNALDVPFNDDGADMETRRSRAGNGAGILLTLILQKLAGGRKGALSLKQT